MARGRSIQLENSGTVAVGLLLISRLDAEFAVGKRVGIISGEMPGENRAVDVAVGVREAAIARGFIRG